MHAVEALQGESRMKMHMLSGGRVRMRKSTYFPGSDRSQMIELPVSCILMRHAQGNVLFDTGCHPGVAENPEPRLAGMSKFMIPIMAPRRQRHHRPRLMGDGRIVLLPLPGHTPGMMGALVGLDNSGEYLLASDALSIRENLDRDIIPRNSWNADLCAQSFAEIRRIEAAGAKIICGHDAAQWDSLRKGIDAHD
jgi:glyoxylase-like metal-dependent hydrolase (beta-lactamase superfamily II)